MFGKISRRSRLSVVLPLDDVPLIPRTIAFLESDMLKRKPELLISMYNQLTVVVEPEVASKLLRVEYYIISFLFDAWLTLGRAKSSKERKK